MQENDVSAEELSAFVDGELDDARTRTVAARIAAVPALAERVAQLKADKERLMRAYGPLIHEPVPQALLDRVARSDRADQPAPRAPFVWWPAIAAAMAAVVAIVVAIWFAYGRWAGGPTDVLIAEALAARSETLAGAQQVAGPVVASAADRDRIAAENLAVPIKVPDLRKAGYDLAAITVYAEGAQRPSLELRYHNEQGRILTVYLAHRPAPEGFQLVTRGPLRVCIWQTEELSAVMTGEMATSEMLRLASLTYADLNL